MSKAKYLIQVDKNKVPYFRDTNGCGKVVYRPITGFVYVWAKGYKDVNEFEEPLEWSMWIGDIATPKQDIEVLTALTNLIKKTCPSKKEAKK